MREWTPPSMLPAIARARTVFAVPGTSSKRTWPLQARAASTSLISSCLPRTTDSRFARKREATSIAASVDSLTPRVLEPLKAIAIRAAGKDWHSPHKHLTPRIVVTIDTMKALLRLGILAAAVVMAAVGLA